MKWTNGGAGRIQVKRFNDAWGKLGWENNTFIELTGIIGGEERRSTLTNVFGSNVREDVTAAKEKIGTLYNWTITAANAAEVIKAVLAELPALHANRPVKDERKTAEAVAAQNAESAQYDQERKIKDKAINETYIALYGSGETVTIQPGEMAVTARLCYDNSDLMSDYFDSHASLSPRFALMVVKKQAETERLARSAVAIRALFAGMEFKWHTEKWSMGHGNYLQAPGFELPEVLRGVRTVYGGGPVQYGHWEIQFEAAYREPKEMPTIKGYGGSTVKPGDAEYEALKAQIAKLEAK